MQTRRAVVMGWGLLLLGCSGSGPTGPTSAVEWRGAIVTGDRAVELPALLERAWPRVATRWPGWSPAGWTITGWPGRIPCDGYVNGSPAGCRGTTITARHAINVSWLHGPADVIAIAAWELCNAARASVTGVVRDVGCG